MKRQIAIGETNRRVGEDHPRARLTNDEVDLLISLHDAGWSYRHLADKFEISKSSVAMIVKGFRRAQVAVRWKVVHMGKG